LRPERTLDYAREFEGTILTLLREGANDASFLYVDPERDAPLFTLALTPFFPIAGREHPALPEAEKLGAVVDWFVELWKYGRAPARKEHP
jgi:hypothetical protein